MKSIQKVLCMTVMMCALVIGTVLTSAPLEAAEPAPVVIMETSLGRIIIILDPKSTPITVKNFLMYVNAGYYDGTVFHRVVKEKAGMNIVQGGGYTYPLKRKNTAAPIVCESPTGLLNKKGTIAMARTDNPNSATSEFFFNAEDNPIFDYVGGENWREEISSVNMGYCAFGRVIRGMDVVEKILAAKTTKIGRMDDVPVKPIYITKAYVAK